MRVTARGAGLCAAAVALLAAGLPLGYPHLAVVGTACLAALAFAGGYVWWRPRLTVTREVEPDRVMRGESSTVTLHVGNSSRLRGATLIAHDRCGAATVPVPLLRLKAGGTTTAGYPVPTARRGVVTIGPLRVVRRDPLGLLALSRGYGGVSTVWVYPKVHHLSAVPSGVARSLDGRVDRVPHGSITFDTLREYVVGDELRHVHWRTTARIGELMVREHLDTSLPRLVVLLDDRLAAYPDRDRDRQSAHFESACEGAASIVMAAFREELPVALRLVSGAHAGGRGSRGFLDVLAEAELHDDDRLDTTVAELRTRRAGDTLIYLTGPGGAADLGRVGTLCGAYATVVAGAFGVDEAPAALDRLVVLTAHDGVDFAATWDGVQSW
ncbi:hypothetical protein GCM10010399_75290 [Dactylosporangium fulvum]|uniref:DUF58 domain-containing protein n=1 Tax=Dactylosporangium fulvum TaxID=53359 RepID=A0ABY5W3I7_9ACTN|nr:DUF58 domain-containing protein [Dactylosporangium fulvum]UWP84573.1 DUF58 domain-containing protein [Dactylosporangium fulvum]